MSDPGSPPPTLPPPVPSRSEPITLDGLVRAGFLALFIWLSLSMLAPFGMLALWAVILAVAVAPLHGWLAARLGGRARLAAVLVTLVLLALLIGPLAVLATDLALTLEALAAGLHGGWADTPPALPEPVERIMDLPMLGPALADLWTQATTDLGDLLRQYAGRLVGVGTVLLGFAERFALGLGVFGLAVILSGVLLVHGAGLAEAARAFARRILGQNGGAYVDMAGATIRGVSQGVIGVALLQAILVGIGLMVAGVPAHGLLALAVAVLGIVQIGPIVVTIPVLIWSGLQQDTLTTFLLALWLLPISLLDNLLKPLLIARGLATPMAVIFAGVIGGTLTHGLVGLFLGPVVLAVFYEMLVIWVRDDRGPEAERETR